MITHETILLCSSVLIVAGCQDMHSFVLVLGLSICVASGKLGYPPPAA